jgi:hypothetical protein
MSALNIVFVHGYSVTNFDTYGGLPLRLRNEALARGIDLNVDNIHLGRYISFNDQVLLSDVARALEHAVKQQLPKDARFVVITHSTGGPVVRTWWRDYYQRKQMVCPMSHLIMLAPANHGSSLAQLGKSKLSRLRSWFEGLEPGQGILNWLELGSAESWELNSDWIFNGEQYLSSTGVYPFVITGQDIDRKMYDHINSYTGEVGSDGAVRVSSANLNSAYLELIQDKIASADSVAPKNRLIVGEYKVASPSPFKILHRKSHSGDKMGIMRSVQREISDESGKELVDVVFRCISVNTNEDYEKLTADFNSENKITQQELKVEVVKNSFRDKLYFHDRHSMIIFRIMDNEGKPLTDFDLVITGDDDDPDQLPEGFFQDRQCNHVHPNTLTYYFNYDVMTGQTEVRDPASAIVRKAVKPLSKLGFNILVRPLNGFVRYQPCKIAGSKQLFEKVIRPNCTTLIDIRLKRVISDENFRFEKVDENSSATFSFKDVRPGEGVVF